MPGHRQHGPSSVEGWLRAIQRARERAVLECGYTSFEVCGLIPQLMKDEHGSTVAKAITGHAFAR